jgi:hypothetical protein
VGAGTCMVRCRLHHLLQHWHHTVRLLCRHGWMWPHQVLSHCLELEQCCYLSLSSAMLYPVCDVW